MIYNSLIYITLAAFTITFALDLTTTIRQAWHTSAPAAPAAPVAPPESPTTASTAPAPIIDPWTLPDPTPTATAFESATPAPMLLLPPARTIATPQPPQSPTSPVDLNQVLTVTQLRKKATAAGIKNAGRMRKNQLLQLLAV
ncbi:MAG: hypothetical protein HC862_21980 [Scytonema sp. RU_4_4]|nr:hypothetical protein [Scytonema sp. RU_4_4]